MYLHGKFKITPPLQANHLAYLERFSQVRHMKRDVLLLEKMRDPLREAVGLPLGLEGAYYVAGTEDIISEQSPTIIELNMPPDDQIDLWCPWSPNGDGEFYVWLDNGGRPRYHKEWLEYLIEHFFNPWNYKLSGMIECSYHYCKYITLQGDEEHEVEIRYVNKSELLIKDDNIVIENVLGTFKDE
jgi:hypothetical protein